MTHIYNGCSYDLSSFYKHHPGGKQVLKNLVGKDITDVVNTHHASYVDIDYYLQMCPKEELHSSPPTHTFDDDYYLLLDRAITWYKKRRISMAELDELIVLIMFNLMFASMICVLTCDLSHWTVLAIGLFNIPVRILLGAYGHQGIHLGKWYEIAITYTAMQFHVSEWRTRHNYLHHIYTNDETLDTDLIDMQTYDRWTCNLRPAVKFAILAVIQVFGYPVIALINIRQLIWQDVTVILYGLLEMLACWQKGYDVFVLFWLVKFATTHAWFLFIHYINHYDHSTTRNSTAKTWGDKQIDTSQNVVLSTWLYENYPVLHSAMCFGLDRQVEHHLLMFLPFRAVADPYIINQVEKYAELRDTVVKKKTLVAGVKSIVAGFVFRQRSSPHL